MDIEPIILALRQRCPVFAQRVAGAAEYAGLNKNAAFAVPSAFVIPMDDSPGALTSQTSYRQQLLEGFAVLVAVSNEADPRGQAAQGSVHAVRAQLWRALLGWAPSEEHGPVRYDGGELQAMDRARLWWRFDFEAEYEISGSDGETWQEGFEEGLPGLEGVTVRVDMIDPAADPSLQYPGPDGRIEHQADIDLQP